MRRLRVRQRVLALRAPRLRFGVDVLATFPVDPKPPAPRRVLVMRHGFD